MLQGKGKRAHLARAAPRARNSLLVHRSDEDNTSDVLSNTLNYHNKLNLNLHIGFCCCHQIPLAQDAADARAADA